MNAILNRKKDIIVILVIFLLALCPFSQSILSNGRVVAGLTEGHFGIDTPYSQIDLSAKLIKSGMLPLWNNMIGAGHPLLANAEAGVFYPLDLPVFLVFPTHIAYNLSLFFHFFLIGVFTYCYCRIIKIRRLGAFFASIVFMFSAFVISHLDGLSRVRAMAWMPFLFLAIERYIRQKNKLFIFIFGFGFGLQLLSGYYSLAVYSAIGCFTYAFMRLFSVKTYRKEIIPFTGYFLLALILAAGISAIQNLPTLELFSHSIRSFGNDYEFFSDNSLSFSSLFTLISPFAFDGAQFNFDIQTRMYIGLFPLLCFFLSLFLVRNKVKFAMAALLGVFFIIALGANSPFYPFILKVIPPMKYLGRSYRFMFIVTFFMAVLSGMGFARLISIKRVFKLRAVIFIFIIVTAVDLVFFACRHLGVFVKTCPDRKNINYKPEAVGFLEKNLGDKRIFTISGKDEHNIDVLGTNANMRFGFPSVSGTMVLPLKWYQQIRENMDSGLDLSFFRLASVKYILSDTQLNNPLLYQRYEKNNVRVYEVPNPLERSRLVSSARIARNFQEAINIVKEGNLDLEKEVLIEGRKQPFLPGEYYTKKESVGKVLAVFENANKLVVDAEILTPCFLVLSDIYYPGWQVYIDGVKSVIYRANGAFRAVYLKPGDYKVEFFYGPLSFKLGLLITIFTITGLGTLYIYTKTKLNTIFRK